MKQILLNILFSLLVVFPWSSQAKDKRAYRGKFYFNQVFGNIHKNPSRYSQTLTTIACGHPLKIFLAAGTAEQTFSTIEEKWVQIKVGPYRGYMKKEFISTKYPNCFQDRYPRFFDLFNLEVEDIYYWGRLYDQYIIEKPLVNQKSAV